LEKYTDKLLEMGFLVLNPSSAWAAAPNIVPKPKSAAKYRMTIDLRPINSATVPETWPMPNVEAEASDFQGSTCFAVLDFVSGYWQLPLDKDSQHLHSFITPRGVVSPTRTQQGSRNAAQNFQAKVEPLFAELRDRLKAWLDDFLLYCTSEDELLDSLLRFFTICSDYNLYLSAKKCEFFQRTVRWCGRLISPEGVQLDPSRLSGLKHISLPQTAGELCEYVHCLRWMSRSIPDFVRVSAPLQEILERAYALKGKRTRRSIQRIPLKSLSWGTKHTEAFHKLQDSLKSTVCLAYPDPEKTVCLYTDASELHWSAIVTQADAAELRKDIEEQKHAPLAFIGSSFSKTEMKWSTFEKEAFAISTLRVQSSIVRTCTRASHCIQSTALGALSV